MGLKWLPIATITSIPFLSQCIMCDKNVEIPSIEIRFVSFRIMFTLVAFHINSIEWICASWASRKMWIHWEQDNYLFIEANHSGLRDIHSIRAHPFGNEFGKKDGTRTRFSFTQFTDNLILIETCMMSGSGNIVSSIVAEWDTTYSTKLNNVHAF